MMALGSELKCETAFVRAFIGVDLFDDAAAVAG
jgi:hypothetical protein